LSHADGQQGKFTRLGGGHAAGASTGISGIFIEKLAHRGWQERNSTLLGIGLKKIPLKFSSRPRRPASQNPLHRFCTNPGLIFRFAQLLHKHLALHRICTDFPAESCP